MEALRATGGTRRTAQDELAALGAGGAGKGLARTASVEQQQQLESVD